MFTKHKNPKMSPNKKNRPTNLNNRKVNIGSNSRVQLNSQATQIRRVQLSNNHQRTINRQQQTTNSLNSRLANQNSNRSISTSFFPSIYDPFECFRASNLRGYALRLWSFWDIELVPALENFVYTNAIKLITEQKKINIDPVNLLFMAFEILVKNGEDPTAMNELYEQVLAVRNCWAHFKFLASMLNRLQYETNQQVKLLYDFLGLIGERSAATNLTLHWLLLCSHRMDSPQALYFLQSNCPRVKALKFTALFEFYVSASIEEFLYENNIVNEKDSALYKLDPFKILKRGNVKKIFLRKGLDNSTIASFYDNIRQSRDFSFHPGSSSKLNARSDLLYINNLITSKAALDIMGKKEARQRMMESAKILFPLMINEHSSPL